MRAAANLRLGRHRLQHLDHLVVSAPVEAAQTRAGRPAVSCRCRCRASSVDGVRASRPRLLEPRRAGGSGIPDRAPARRPASRRSARRDAQARTGREPRSARTALSQHTASEHADPPRVEPVEAADGGRVAVDRAGRNPFHRESTHDGCHCQRNGLASVNYMPAAPAAGRIPGSRNSTYRTRGQEWAHA